MSNVTDWRREYQAHGKVLTVRRVHNVYHLQIAGETRVRWATYAHERDADVAYFLENGTLPPRIGTSWA